MIDNGSASANQKRFSIDERTKILGITLVETVLVLAILGIVVGVALPAYDGHRQKMERSAVLAEILEITNAIDSYFYDNLSYPETLEDVRMEDRVDTWGNPYQYLKIAGAASPGKGGVGNVRKDKNLVPINTDYDLYSMGPDGRSVGPLTAKHSRDDLVRANNGAYLGVAEKY
ncbi:MAG: hypothetical protein AB8C02_17575 [Halioglobus sp.]